MASLVLGAAPSFTHSLILSSRTSFSKSEALGVPLSSSSATSRSISAIFPPPPPGFSVYCGRGDKKTARGKRFNHSFGNARPHGKNKGRGPPRVPVPPSPPKKDRFENDEIVKIEIDEF
ncbi:hypothetical protein F2P56_008333 [Juglans regia]|uniref:30S ribosomal protein S31, chloroplastic n=2 Tax=Juglans regia TaxID=51240 RepID=A0A833XUE9_JUGRE|nr:30S ribosomal protein S31, chloroplastic [Juglans regia]KAF5471552.1 hypothetical protein F2P56_008333 [Juglans regia]